MVKNFYFKTRGSNLLFSNLLVSNLFFIVSDHLDQIGSGPKSWRSLVVPTQISPKNPFRGPQRGFLWPKNRGSKKKFEIFFIDFHRVPPVKTKENSDFFFKKNFCCPVFSSIKSLFEWSWVSFRVKTARNPYPFIKWGTGADLIQMITDYQDPQLGWKPWKVFDRNWLIISRFST